MKNLALPLLSLLAAPLAFAQSGKVLIPVTSFDSKEEFDKYWGPLYPWGSDHNGSARMRDSQVRLENGTVTITAQRVNGEPQATHGGKKLDIRYLSGAIHALEHYAVQAGGGIDYIADLKVKAMAPEIDMAEWKGTGKISFNTFNTSSQVSALDVAYPDPDEFHSFKCETRDINGRDVSVKFYMDDNVVAEQVGRDYVGKTMYL
ncbi:unnamed protein product [Parascedosporium putredinis]|uniref:Uncharacterized protein n=1 Tax=Parascedosporium putredinis TaxID=1442378 RepID=A0A9P1GUS3_9PEZI|nr:unnamed protein product [Parascedosporium putredinis]CAI7988024.1 unnamed protein product [Parascedosporium putredinis]